MESPQQGVHLKFLSIDFNILTIRSTIPAIFVRRETNLPVMRVEVLGTVVFHNRKEKFLRFAVDDGTGCVQCVLWLNHKIGSGDSNAPLLSHMAHRFAEMAQLGRVVRVRGRVSYYRGEIQLTVRDVIVERDPNMQVLHWLECIKLSRQCYKRLQRQ